MARKKPAPKKPRKGAPPVPPAPPEPPADPAAAPLDEGEQRFVDEFLVDRRATNAYRRAFPGVTYQTARRNAPEMRSRPNVHAEISAGVAAQRVRTQITADRVQDEIARVAFSDVYELFDPATNTLRQPRSIPFETRKAIASVKVSRGRSTKFNRRRRRTTVTDCVIEYKLWPKMDALQKLCTQLGMKTELSPLDAVLRALPPDLAAAVREVLATPQTVAHAPHQHLNGNGKH